MSKKEQVCTYCNKKKAVVVERGVFHYCVKCLWKQSEKQTEKWDPRRGEGIWEK